MSSQKVAIIVLVVIGVLSIVAISIGFIPDSKPESSTPKDNKGGTLDLLSGLIADHTRIQTQDIRPQSGPAGFFVDRTFRLPPSTKAQVRIARSDSSLRTMELSVVGTQSVEIGWKPEADPSVPIQGDPPSALTKLQADKPLRITVMKAGGMLTASVEAGTLPVTINIK